MEISIMLHKEFRVLGDVLKAIEYTSSSPDIVDLHFIKGNPPNTVWAGNTASKDKEKQPQVNIHQPPIGDNS